MNNIKDLFKEIRGEVIKSIIITALLDSLMLFFMMYFLLSFFNIKFIYYLILPGAITLIFFIIIFVKQINRMRLKDIEDSNPELKEMLRTAYDNKEADSAMAEALFMEVKTKVRKVSAGSIVDSKKIMVRTISAIAIVFLIIFTSSLNVNIEKIEIPFEKLKFMIPTTNDNKEYAEGQITELVFNETEVIYGDKSIAKLGDEEIDLNFNTAINDIDFSNVEDTDNEELREGDIPQEIGITADVYAQEEALEEAKKATEYSQRIKNI